MSVLLTHDIPVNREAMEAVTRALGVRQNPPDGLIVHVITETSEGVRVVEVWESAQHYEEFRDTRLAPVLGQVMADHGIVAPDKLPKPTITPAHDLVRGRQVVRAGLKAETEASGPVTKGVAPEAVFSSPGAEHRALL